MPLGPACQALEPGDHECRPRHQLLGWNPGCLFLIMDKLLSFSGLHFVGGGGLFCKERTIVPPF